MPLLPRKILLRLERERFIVSWLGVLLNPYYIVRAGLLRVVNEWAGEISGRVLDFGCGSKPYEELFTKVEEYIGLDTKSSGHDHTKSKVDVFYDGGTLPFDSESMDAVVSFEVLEHVFDPSQTLEEISRVLKPSGKFLISVPFAWEETEPPFDFARYTVFGLRHLLEQAGFEILRQSKTTSSFLASRQISIALRFRSLRRVKHFLPVLQLLLIFPATLSALLWNRVIPSDSSLYSNQVILAQKPIEPRR